MFLSQWLSVKGKVNCIKKAKSKQTVKILHILVIYVPGCCIYEKPRKFGESSSSDSDNECDHCQGHVERKKKKKLPTSDSLVEGDNSTVNSEPCPAIDN